MGDSYFNIYQNEKPSGIANDAISLAFKLWGYTSSRDKISNAANLLTNDDYIWDTIAQDILSTSYNSKDKKKISEGREFLENLINKVKSPKSKTAMLYYLGSDYFYDKEIEKAFYCLNEVIKINADEWRVIRSKAIINEIKNLNIGQPAPNFCIKDNNDNEICLNKLKGKYILIHSWTLVHGDWAYKNIKDIYNKFHKFENFYMIGVSAHPKEELSKKTIIKENFLWPQIIQNYETKNELLNLYNINSGFKMYLIDPNGIIIYKDFESIKNNIDLIEKLNQLLKK